MSAAARRFSVWLLPARPTRRALRPLLEAGARHGFGVRFEPHVTLCSGSGVAEGGPEAHAARVARSAQALTVRVRGVRTGPTWSRSVYLAVEATPELARLRAALRAGWEHGAALDAPPFPHLSLAYGVPRDGRRALVRRIRELGLPGVLELDALVVVRPGPSSDGFRDVAAWRAGTPVGLAR